MGRLTGQAVVLAGVGEHALVGAEGHLDRRTIDRLDDLHDGKVVLGGELEVALVVGRDAHDGAGAVVGQDVVGHPDRNLRAVIGIDGEAAGGNAVLLDGSQVAGFASLLLLLQQFVHLRLQLGVGSRESRHQRVLWRQLHAGRAEDGVHAGGENADARAFTTCH